jgi:hypothetical protein
MEEGKRVEIYDGWFGVVVRGGPTQSLVKIIKTEPGYELLEGQERHFINTDLKQEINEMPTVAEITAQYNAIARSKSLREVKLFKDRATAERRLAAISNDSTAGEPDPGKQNSGSGQDSIVNMFKFKKSAKPNQRQLLLRKFVERGINEMISKKELGNLASSIGGLEWQIRENKIPAEIREEKRDGQAYCGLYEKKRIHGE